MSRNTQLANETAPLLEITAEQWHVEEGVAPLTDRRCKGRMSDKGTNEELNKRARRKLMVASVFCVLFMVAEIVGGFLANSLAVLTDAAHLLSDVAAFLISLFALHMSAKAPTSRNTFGYHRAEILGALVSVVLIWVLTAGLVYEAIKRIISPEPVEGRLMFIIASLGLVVNLVMGWILLSSGGHGHSHGGLPEEEGIHGHSHGTGKRQKKRQKQQHRSSSSSGHEDLSSYQGHAPDPHDHDHEGHDYSHDHSHDHSHSHSHRHSHGHAHDDKHGHGDKEFVSVAIEEGEHKIDQQPLLESYQSAEISFETESAGTEKEGEEENINVKAAFIHVLGDGLQSVGVMIAAGLIWYNPSWYLADPICTLLFAVIVIFTTTRLVRQSVTVLMEGTPANINVESVDEALHQIEGVKEVHDLHIWSLSVGKPSLSVHIIARDEASRKGVLAAATAMLEERFGILHTTIQVEVPADRIPCADDLNKKQQQRYVQQKQPQQQHPSLHPLPTLTAAEQQQQQHGTEESKERTGGSKRRANATIPPMTSAIAAAAATEKEKRGETAAAEEEGEKEEGGGQQHGAAEEEKGAVAAAAAGNPGPTIGKKRAPWRKGGKKPRRQQRQQQQQQMPVSAGGPAHHHHS